MSTAPRPHTSPSTISPPNGSRVQPAGLTGHDVGVAEQQQRRRRRVGAVEAGDDGRPIGPVRRVVHLERPRRQHATSARRRCAARRRVPAVPSLTQRLRISVDSSSAVRPADVGHVTSPRPPAGAGPCTACSRPSGSRYSALPATSTLAPAAAAPADGVGADAAVDLDVDGVGEPGGVDHPAHLGDLRLHRGDVRLAAEAGVDGHHEHEVDEVEDVGDGARRASPG